MNRTRSRTGLLAALLAFPLVALAADRDLGTFKAWRAHTFVDAKKLVCSIWSQPQTSEGKYTRRGEVFVFVTHRPDEQRSDKVSFEIGYDFEASSQLKVRIDGRDFSLFTDGSTAWSEDPEESATMVRLMRAGRELVVEGVSSRGTKTKDTISLIGFTAAHDAINEACNVR